MNAHGSKRKLGALTRRLIVLPALVVALSLAYTAAASAQTPFQASVSSTLVRGGGTLPSNSCPNGAYSCGTANIAGYGAASWNFYAFPTSIVQTSCGSAYIGTTYFTLDSDGSTLALIESGPLCGPGLDANGYFKGRFPKDYGRPYSAVGTWSTITTPAKCSIIPATPPPGYLPLPCSLSTGQFAGLGGSGTDTLYFAGAHAHGSYSGTLG